MSADKKWKEINEKNAEEDKLLIEKKKKVDKEDKKCWQEEYYMRLYVCTWGTDRKIKGNKDKKSVDKKIICGIIYPLIRTRRNLVPK